MQSCGASDTRRESTSIRGDLDSRGTLGMSVDTLLAVMINSGGGDSGSVKDVLM